MKLAGLSIDVDSVASHLEGYGFERSTDDGSAYRLAIPRAMEVFEGLRARATFFLVAEEAARHANTVREIVRRGHEVASHSMTHRLPFADLGDERAEHEVIGSKLLLEKLSGQRVDGFRAPSWDAGDDLLDRVAAAGYTYDASAFPSILLPLLRRSIASRSSDGRTRSSAGNWDGVFGPTEPHLVKDRGVWEVPICTTPIARLPYYHTLRFILPPPAFRLLGAWARTRSGPVTYQFHAADFLGRKEDDLDARISRHPGMNRGLTEKLALAEECVSPIARSRTVVPLRELVESLSSA